MHRQLLSLALVGASTLPVVAQWVCVPLRPVCLPPVVYFVPCQPAPQLPPPRISQDPSTPDTIRPAAGLATPTSAVPQLDAPKPAPKITFDPIPQPKVEPLQLPIAQPKSAEPEGVKIPPLIPRLPGADSGLPPLSLPAPTTESTSRSSPLNAKLHAVVDVFPVDGPPPASPLTKRTIGFFNHTDRDVRLTVEGETITLPKRHQVTATVAAKFRWTLDDGPARTTEVPTAAPGLEVVVRK